MDWALRLSFANDPKKITAIRRGIGAILRAVGVTRSNSLALQMAVAETLTNTYKHAYQNEIGPVDLVLERTDTSVIITVTNYGEVPKTPLVIPPADEQALPGGLYLIGRLVDEVEITTPVRGDRGVAIRMVKQLPEFDDPKRTTGH